MGRKDHDTQRDEAAFKALTGQLRALLAEAEGPDAANKAGETGNMPLHASNRADGFEQLVQEQFARIAAQLDNLSKRLDKMPTAPQRPEEVPGYAELKTVLHNLIEHLELAEGRTAEAIGDLREKLEDVARRTAKALEMAESGGDAGAPETRAALQVLEQRIDALNKRLEDMRASSEESARAYVDTCIQEVEKKIESLQSATAPDSEALADMVRRQVEQQAGEQMRQAEERMASMVARLQGKLEDLAGGVMDVDRLRTDVEQLDSHVRQVQQALQGLSARVEEKADRAETQALRQQLDELAAQLQQAHAAAPADDARLHALEEQVLNIRQLVEEALGEPLSMIGEKLSAHEEQIGKLMQLDGIGGGVDEEQANRLAALEKRIAQLQQALAARDQAPGDAEQGSGSEMEALRAGMADLEKFARDSDTRTREMMQTMHEALAEVVKRLDALERQEASAPAQRKETTQQASTATQQAAAPQPAAAEALLGEPAPAQAAEAPSKTQSAGNAREKGALREEVAQVVALMQGKTPAAQAADPVSASASAPSASGAAPRQPAAGRPDTPPAHDAIEEDFIAAARRAAMAASNGGAGKAATDSKGKFGGLFARFGKGRQAQEKADEPQISANAANVADPAPNDAAEDADSSDRKKKSVSLLSGLSSMRGNLQRRKKDVEESAENAPAEEEDAAPRSAASRRRLMLAGVVLLSAAAVLISRQQGQQPAAPASAPVVQDKAVEAAPGTGQTEKARITPRHGGKADEGAASVRDEKPASGEKSANPDKLSDAAGSLPPDRPRAATELQTASITGLATAPRATSTPAAASGSAAGTPMMAPQTSQPLPAGIGPAALRAAALNGDGKAAYVVATNYLRGRGVARNAEKAAYWFRKAADKGVVVAMYRLGVLHEQGIGVRRDLLQARIWYERAAERGNVRAMHNLAVLLASGKAGQPDYEQAARWFRKAAEHGVRDSQFNLAVLHHRGQGVERSLPDAWFWYATAARQGDTAAAEQESKLAAYLPASVLAKARERLAAFTPTPPIRNANAVIIERPEWRNVSASIEGHATSQADKGKVLQGKALVMEVQRLLKRVGYDIGKVDGIMGSRTANAIRLFQMQTRMKVTGTPSMEVLESLRRHAASI